MFGLLLISLSLFLLDRSGFVSAKSVPCTIEKSTDTIEPSLDERCANFRRGGENATSTTETTVTTFKAWYFEGVDYTLLPNYIRREKNDCHELYIWCVRRTTPLMVVCGYNILTARYEDFYNLCELEFENCEYRIRYHIGLYGKSRTDDPTYHNGETNDCVFYYRRANSAEEMDRLYFGGDKEEVLAKWRAMNRAKDELSKMYNARGLAGLMEQDGNMEQRNMGQYTMGQETMGQEIMGQQIMGQQIMGQDTMGQETMGQQIMGQDMMRQQTMGQQIMRQNMMGQQIMRQDTMGQQTMGQQGMSQAKLMQDRMRQEKMMMQMGIGQNSMMGQGIEMSQGDNVLNQDEIIGQEEAEDRDEEGTDMNINLLPSNYYKYANG